MLKGRMYSGIWPPKVCLSFGNCPLYCTFGVALSLQKSSWLASDCARCTAPWSSCHSAEHRWLMDRFLQCQLTDSSIDGTFHFLCHLQIVQFEQHCNYQFLFANRATFQLMPLPITKYLNMDFPHFGEYFCAIIGESVKFSSLNYLI